MFMWSNVYFLLLPTRSFLPEQIKKTQQSPRELGYLTTETPYPRGELYVKTARAITPGEIERIWQRVTGW